MNRIESKRTPTAAGASNSVPSPKTPSPVQISGSGAPVPAADRFKAEAGQAPAARAKDPHSELTDIRQRRADRGDAAQAVKKPAPKELSREQMLHLARKEIVRSFEKDFVPSPEFQDTFGQSWAEVKDRVKADAKVFGSDPDFPDSPNPDGSTTFIGRIYGLYTEVTVNRDGSVGKPYFEID